MRRLLAAGVLLGALAPAAVDGAGIALSGTDHASIQLPVSGLAESYGNHGYHAVVSGGIAEVAVWLAPLESRERFALPLEERTSDPLGRLARSLVADTSTRYEAVSRVLSWVARNVTYELDRAQPQEPEAVLERRSAYCTGIARLTVALLQTLGIDAREVAGYVAASPLPGVPAGYHRWVEVDYGRGVRAFSDPLASHHYVPATYVPLSSETLLPQAELDSGRVRERRDRRVAVDVFPAAPPGISARRNDERQLAASLLVVVDGGGPGVARLEGAGSRRTQALSGGVGAFVGLELGTYTLEVLVEDKPPLHRRLVFRDRVRASVHFPADEWLPAPTTTRESR
ncbi:MAG TPA: transglutaminase-like domain-containing protein [Thermoanaerobaculia bacterium]|nr:transglutaminase-like domain-containing protein [Thermoanaerobaculia bacterium]